MADNRPTCPHCGVRLTKWLVPDGAGWVEEFFYVCFNNECDYYEKGWAWMKEQFDQKCSYRYMLNPATGAASPLPVWSDSAMREMIAPEDAGEDK